MSERIVKSFKAVIVMTRHDGVDPTLQDVEVLLRSANVAYGMPGQPDSPIVISLSDAGMNLPPREGTVRGTEKVLDPPPELGDKKAAAKD